MPLSDRPTFRVEASESPTGETLLVALPQLGMANLTAADYLVQHHEAPTIGYVDTEDLPSMTPIQNGRPRRHTRLFDLPETEVTVLLGELFVPVWAARGFVDAVSEFIAGTGVAEVLLLHGVPFPHAETEHGVYTVATDDFRERRLAGIESIGSEVDAELGAPGDGPAGAGAAATEGVESTEEDGSDGIGETGAQGNGEGVNGDEDRSIEPLRGAVFDGVPGEFLDRNLDESEPAVGSLVTPTHPPGPDVDAALRLLEAVETVYGFDIDLAELEEAAVKTRQFYAELGDRMQSLQQSEEAVGSRDYPEDRMYM